MYRFFNIVLLSIIISGCGILDPWTYKMSKQQGNITKQKLLDKLEIGMTREQVRFIMGTPMTVDSFNMDRWDYLYNYKPGHGEQIQNNITLYFTDEKLSKIEGKPLIKGEDAGQSDTSDS